MWRRDSARSVQDMAPLKKSDIRIELKGPLCTLCHLQVLTADYSLPFVHIFFCVDIQSMRLSDARCDQH